MNINAIPLFSLKLKSNDIIVLMFLILITGCSSVNMVENGYGKIMTEDGSVYSGEINNGKATGFGKTITHDGAIYEGEHVNGQFHGNGKLTLSNGSYFIDTMNNNKVDKGSMYFTDGRVINIL